MKDVLYYLASPYSHDCPAIRVARFHQANFAAAILMNFGILTISPISHSHPIHLDANGHELPLDSASFWFWQDWNRVLFDRCDGLIVLTLEGWEDSSGVHMEQRWAREQKKPIWYVEPSYMSKFARTRAAELRTKEEEK